MIRTDTLPTIPHTLVELVHAFEQPTVEFNHLAQIISQDPSMTAKVYQLGKSVYFNQWREVKQLQQLLVIFGMDTVRHLSLLCATEQFFAQYSQQMIGNISTIWYRSILCANLAEELASILGYTPKDDAYLAGLLHRIGQLILAFNDQENYFDNVDSQQPLAQAEKNELSEYRVTSTQIGADFIAEWEVCPFVADAVRFQTKPVEALSDSTTLVRLLHLSTTLCELNKEKITVAVYEASLLFDLNESMVEQVFDRAQQKTKKIISCFNNSALTPTDDPEKILYNSNARYNQRLETQVKNYALTNAMHMSFRQLATNREAFQRLRRDFYLLFGFKDLSFLLAGAEDESLSGYDDQGLRPEMFQITVYFETSTSLALQALKNRQVMATPEHSQDNLSSIADHQLKNVMGAKELCFIPLVDGKKNLGVIAAATNDTHWAQLADKKSLLELAAQLSCKILNGIITTNSLLQKRQAQEREEISLQLRSAAHEINNPLSIINNYLHLLTQQANDPEQQQRLDIIQEEIMRVSTMVAGLKEVTRDSAVDTRKVNINQLIVKLQQLLMPSLFNALNQQLILQLDPAVGIIESCASSLKQILINLLKNASEALPQQGKVWITTHNKVYRSSCAYLEIEISDNGTGIDEEILAKLFKPVVSKKKNHSGLGLAIVKNLVDQLHGEISCSSSATGTRFQILLPHNTEQGVE